MIQTGNVLSGFSVSQNKFQGVTNLAQIEAYGLIRPTQIDKVSKGLSPQQQSAHELRAVTNRSFDKARIDNASDYSGYIEAVEVHGRPGGTPAITLFHQAQLTEVDGGILIPYGAGIVAIDGETQTEARYILRDRNMETAGNPFAITVYHGIPVDMAMQILHDYNTKGLAWNESKAARFNRTGQLSLAAEQALTMSGVLQENVNLRGDKATKKTTVALKQILTGIAGYQLNGKGSETAVSASHFKRFNDAAAVAVPPTCVNQFADIIRAAQANRQIGLAPPQVWQIAGVLLSKNRQPAQLNWDKGVAAFTETKASGRGGPRMEVKARLAAIETAMSS